MKYPRKLVVGEAIYMPCVALAMSDPLPRNVIGIIPIFANQQEAEAYGGDEPIWASRIKSGGDSAAAFRAIELVRKRVMEVEG